ncbi:MAG: oxygen-independent coproporphyrinogen III oxidase, partial [Steroidobacteraceae bacterium]
KPLAAHVHAPLEPAAGYLQRLLLEIELHAGLFDQRRTLERVHFGAQLPALFTIGRLGRIVTRITECFSADESAQRELSIEIDPRTVRRETFAGLAMLGFKRATLSVRDFSDIRQVKRAFARARAAGLAWLGLDLIYGMPLQAAERFAATLDTLIAMRPDRVAAYAVQPTDAQARMRLLALAVERLTAAGYVHIGMSHFALPQDELTEAPRSHTLHWNLQSYSTHAGSDLIGLGVGAISAIGNTYARSHKDLAAYQDALDHQRLPIERGVELTVDDLVRREIIERILCDGVLDTRQIEEKYALDFASYFARERAQLEQMIADGLLARTSDTLSVTENGRFFLRSIAVVFDTYLCGCNGSTSAGTHNC